MSDRPRVLVLTASIGEGHDLPARLLHDALAERADVVVADALAEVGGLAQRMVEHGSQLDTRAGRAAFEVNHFLVARSRAGRRVAERLASALTGRALRDLVAATAADVVVSTYPGGTGVLARMRRRRTLRVPLVSAITDLTSLHWWAAPGVDLHLLTHPESEAEVRAIAGPATRISAVTGLYDDAFLRDRDVAATRAALDLPVDGRVVVVSGGGWAVGDLEGAARVAAAAPGVTAVVVLCGRRDDVRARLTAAVADVAAIRTWGFTTRIADVLGAADTLVHSTAGLTVLEAQLQGCVPISYGWGGGHIRENNRAFARLGIARVARGRGDLAAVLREVLAAERPAPGWPRHAALPAAADLVLAEAAG